jgi:phage tail sheath protein FI
VVDYELEAPGVYVEEVETAGPIAGTGTSTAAFIGTAASLGEGVSLGRPVPVTNWTGYTGAFGGFASGKALPFAVRGFFENGGSFGYVVPVADAGDGEQVAGALDALTRLPEVSLVCLPGIVDAGVQGKVIDHCEDLHDRFAILDGAQDDTPTDEDGALLQQRGALVRSDGMAALYWPWLRVDDPGGPTGALTTVPPSGHVAGIMARSDGRFGVHKAPANEPVRGVRDLTYHLNDTEHGVLNHAHVNAFRKFPGRPLLLWGARTLTDETPWRYVNVRRLVSYVEDSLLQGLRWAVFAPNNTALWKALERTVTEFLTRIWLSGALFGRTAAEAFYVKIDEELNPASTRALGQVVAEIGLAPVRPAEYVVMRLGLWDGGARISEG